MSGGNICEQEPETWYVLEDSWCCDEMNGTTVFVGVGGLTNYRFDNIISLMFSKWMYSMALSLKSDLFTGQKWERTIFYCI